ncbi:conserved hypothetical protein [Leishmania major strain Friedlin]|uniref:Uncharacterized protein n=1 Tax=Leishmania major TaxID=5664 RepID=Q4QAK8_LEIMA|nr:conserved hypothetical protein [Leishmania major strain Friedlin]CAG9574594.1 hypothetical_protein_-_conserved [Leishmania major strain Friedlin]CAJ04907.1 conserved hypothetical protein [Leishmania major strain Friedlin]|eukprot:XP_001683640.1 conserved hypothetical protein [Leishmania major strain Friedlin]
MWATLARYKAKSLAQMFRKLKLAGAHPDVLWGIDAQKAQHNGETMIRLETLMHERASQALGSSSSSPNGHGRDNAPQFFLFWMQPHRGSPAAGGGGGGKAASAAATGLKAIECAITPYSDSRIVKQQLTKLFVDAGIYEDFELSSDGVEMDLNSVLRYADEKQNEHLVQSGSLYIRGDKSVENLRRFSVLLVVEEDGVSYLVSLPETQSVQPTGAGQYTSTVGGGGGGSTAPYVPSKTIIGPNGEVDPDVQDFMTERGLRPFDLRMAGSHSSVERFVVAFERIERMYEVHRGRAFRPSVCIVLSLKSLDNFVAPDGSIVLSVQRMPSWEEFLLSLPQPVWQECVQKHKEWRVGTAPKLQERKRQLTRVADMFHVYRVTMESPIAGSTQWQDDLIARFMKEETTIRRAVAKYNLKSDLLKKCGEIRIVEHLYSALPGSAMRTTTSAGARKEIGFRIGGDGRVTFNHSIMNTGQMLRVLKDNLKRMETFQRQHDSAIMALEHVSRHIPVDFSVDTEWKNRAEGNLVLHLERFARTIKQNEAQLGSFLRSIMDGGMGTSSAGTVVVPASMPVKKRMVWVVSDRFDTLPSGVVFIPFDVDFDSIKRLLLTRQ